MEQVSKDRRVLRTQAALQNAMISLVLKKGYDAVTVEDICSAANVGRSTFYLHYASKDDLKRRGLEHLRKLLADRQKHARTSGEGIDAQPLAFSRTMFEHAAGHADLYRALGDSHGGVISLGSIRDMLRDLVREELAAAGSSSAADPIQCEFAAEYLVGAFMSVLTWWLDSGAQLPVEQVDAMFRRLAEGGLASFDP